MDTHRPVEVCLFGPNGQWRPSMDRFAGDLAEVNSDQVRIWDASTRRRSSHDVSARTEWLRRWVIQPFEASRERADVFHITDHSYAQISLGLPRTRTVITCHDLIPLRAADMDLGFRLSRRQQAQYRLSVRFLHRAARVVANSAATREDIVRYLGVPRERIVIIPQGVSAQFVPLGATNRDRWRSAMGIADQFVLMHVGAVPYKNSETVVRVLAELATKGVETVVLQAGTPWPQTSMKLADELGVRDRIRPLGRVSDQDMVRALNAADTMLFPSLWEGFGYPVAEAMSCGTAVVTSDVPALRELIGDAGLSAGACDVGGLTRHLKALASDVEYRSNVARAGLARSAAFSWTRTRDAYVKLYQELYQKTSSAAQ